MSAVLGSALPHSRSVAAGPEAGAHLLTLNDLLRWAVSRFGEAKLSYGHGCSNAFDEAAALILWSLHLPPDELGDWRSATLTPSERQALIDLIEARCSRRVPAAYLMGETWLRGLGFKCDPRALVPRSVLAEAIDTSFADFLNTLELPDTWPEQVFDLCTGGGSLAVFAADRFPRARVVASDLSEAALDLARENLALHGLTDRIDLRQGDLFDALPPRRRFDLILCNPPYVCDASMSALPDEFHAEPRNALAGGPDGMDLIRQILARAPQHLAPGGLLLLEIGHESQHFEAAFPKLEFTYLPVAAGDTMVVLMERQALTAALRPRTRKQP